MSVIKLMGECMRREWKWTALQLDKLDKVREILKELLKYMPLTLRQIYYQLVGKGSIKNKVSEYTMLSNLLKWARIDGHIPWEDVEDRVRAYHDLTGWRDSEKFIEAYLKHFLSGYKRNLLQTQDKYIEIWIEKDALSSIFIKVAEPYTIPVVVCRGFSSVSFLNEFAERLEYNKDKQAVMLYFGDFDPFGDFDLIFGSDKLNLKIRDIPVRYRERTYGSTNINRWSHGALLFRMLGFAARKLKFT